MSTRAPDTADAYGVLEILQPRGMRATFYVNAQLIGTPGYMSWSQLQDLADAVNEIAGHTLTHENLRVLSTAKARHQVCDDRVSLFEHGFQPTSFAYPFGRFNDGVKQVVRDCGYNSARWVAGVDGRRTFAETIPPRDAYATRTPQLLKSSTSLATLQSYVTDAEQHGGGWVQSSSTTCLRGATRMRSRLPTSRPWPTGSRRGPRGGRWY